MGLARGRARAGVKNAVIEKWAQRLGVLLGRPTDRPTDCLSDLTRTRYIRYGRTDIAFPPPFRAWPASE